MQLIFDCGLLCCGSTAVRSSSSLYVSITIHSRWKQLTPRMPGLLPSVFWVNVPSWLPCEPFCRWRPGFGLIIPRSPQFSGQEDAASEQVFQNGQTARHRGTKNWRSQPWGRVVGHARHFHALPLAEAEERSGVADRLREGRSSQLHSSVDPNRAATSRSLQPQHFPFAVILWKVHVNHPGQLFPFLDDASG